MKRDLIRIRRQHGIKYFALPIIVFLFLMLLLDERISGYLDLRNEVSENINKLEMDHQTLDERKSVESRLAALSSSNSKLSSRIYETTDADQAKKEIQEQLQILLKSLYFENIQFSEFSERAIGSAKILSVTASFSGVPQQLPRLQSAIANSRKILSVDTLDIRVVDDPQRNSQQIAIAVKFNALHVESTGTKMTEPTDKRL